MHVRSYVPASTDDRTYALSSFSSVLASAYSVAKSSYRLRSLAFVHSGVRVVIARTPSYVVPSVVPSSDQSGVE
jgi:hypothetical protein